MPKFAKLLTDVGPNDPPERVARKALKVRLRAVLHYLQRTEKSAAEKAEEIHQLRVWTRRSAAALKLFAPWLPPRKSKKIKKGLRQLRQAAGAVRDLDVLESQVGKQLQGQLAECLAEQRKSARKDLQDAIRDWAATGKLKRKVKRLLARIGKGQSHESNGVTFGPWCRTQLAPLVEDLASRAAKGGRQSDAALHRWRLAAKRLRYALELAVQALPKRNWSRLYRLLSELQDRIGAICDARAESQRLKAWRAEFRDAEGRKALGRLGSQCRKRLAAARQQFARWWTARRAGDVASLCRQAAGAT